MTISEPLPRWDRRSIFPGLDSREYAAGRERLVADVGRLASLYERHDVRGGPSRPPTPEDLAVVEELIAGTNDLLGQVETIEAYLTTLTTADADDDDAATEYSRFQADLTELQRLRSRFDAWVGRLGAPSLVAGSLPAADHAHALTQAAVNAAHQMSEAEEGLLTDLRLTGGSSWERLSQELTARLTGTLDGATVPIALLRGMATDPDRSVRQAAYRAEVAAYETVGVAMAACLNSIKGEAVTLNRRRGWTDSLGPALLDNAVERPALEAMQDAAVAAFPDFRRFLRAKAKLLGRDGALAWWDLFAPVPGEPAVSWEQAGAAVERAFSHYSPQLAGLARRALDEQWVDAEPRQGKSGGGFCIPVRDGESRILINFDGSWDSVQTLAHELGHAYHNANLAPRTPMQRRLPMALAETASIFCETVMVQSALGSADDAGRLSLLNVDLQGACQVVVDIHSRFLFEREVFSRREAGVIPVAELCSIMEDAQLATYGDGLARDTLHRYMWAVKPHYYFADAPYYNWPYCFGLLFGIGLYARYQADPERFRAGYDDLLASTGMGTAAELAGRFGIDITSGAFWTSSLDVIRGRIDEYVRLVG